MAFGESKQSSAKREPLNPSLPSDNNVIKAFERELAPYYERTLKLFEGTVYEKTITGFTLYCHEKNLFRYSQKHKHGAVVATYEEGTAPYMEAQRKYEGLCKLNDQRKFREEEELAGRIAV